jgi:hypothetical protein
MLSRLTACFLAFGLLGSAALMKNPWLAHALVDGSL